MSHERTCKIDSRVFRITQLAHRICKSRDQHEAKQWRRILRKAMAELTERVDEHCERLTASPQPAPTTGGSEGA